MKGIKSIWGQMTQKWFGPKPKDDQAPKTKKFFGNSSATKDTSPQMAPSSSGPSFDKNKGDALTQRLETQSKSLNREEQVSSALSTGSNHFFQVCII